MSTLDNSTVSSTECHDVHHYRTVLGIVQSCAATIFLCIWAVLHLDVPKKPDQLTRLERVLFMILTLLAPEMVLNLACGEWITCTGFLKRLLNEHPTRKWTETHAMFAYMGGFRLVDKNGSKEHPREVAFFKRVLNGEIDIPDIAVEEILDKSKGDGIAKAIVLIQTLWFALQVINRFAQHLPVTELEITTLAHVTINVFMYWCWWNKPLNVMCPIDIYPRNNESDTEEQSPQVQVRDNNVDVLQRNEEVERSEGADGHLMGDEKAPTVQRLRLPIRVRMGAFFADGDGDYVGARSGPVLAILSGIFGGIHCLAWNSTFHTRVESTLWRVCALLVAALPFMLFCGGAMAEAFDIKISSLKGKGRTLAIIGATVKISRNTILLLGLASYIFARICLLVLAALALKTLPEKALLMPSWAQYIPHI